MSDEKVQMGHKTEKVTVRLTPDQVDILNEIMKSEEKTSTSSVIREAIEEFIGSRGMGEYVSMKMPAEHLRYLKVLAQAGSFINVAEGIKVAVREFVAKAPDEAEELRKKYEKIEKERIKLEEAKGIVKK